MDPVNAPMILKDIGVIPACVGHMLPLAERLLSKLDMSGGPDACWPWKGAVSRGGRREVEYGYLWADETRTKRYRVNRLVLFLNDPDGLEAAEARHAEEDAAHLCHYSLCGNPAHLEWQSHKLNARSQGKRKHDPECYTRDGIRRPTDAGCDDAIEDRA